MKKNLIELLTVVGREAYPKMEESTLKTCVEIIANVCDYEEVKNMCDGDKYDLMADGIAEIMHPNWFHKVKIKNIMDSAYEDGTRWIEYLLDEEFLGYIDSWDLSSIVEVVAEGMEEEIQYYVDCEEINLVNLVKKRKISTILPELAELIEKCRQSDNDMWFVEEEDIDDVTLEKIEAEVERLELEEYIEFGNDAAITIYGGIITRFLF